MRPALLPGDRSAILDQYALIKDMNDQEWRAQLWPMNSIDEAMAGFM